ncbi:hypothetical protein [Rhizobium sp. BK176]|uniref:hypothetical protein n=1 Tax=Rhizobium sp. BK176 TaxID=2587071 RepID=UPI0021694EA2|nr:hypothetical protein [Rhizobium sp. BK176]MCS4089259.1 hypothetical protein [Rhizobium sp. BK176]
MNRASAAILRWYLLTLDDGEEHAETLISAIASGMANGDESLRQMFFSLLAKAHETAEESDDYDILTRLFELHFELDALQAAEIRVRNITELMELTNAEPRGPISARIRDLKLKSLLAELGLEDRQT